MWYPDIKSIFQLLKENRISRSDADRMIGTVIAFETAAAKMIDMNIYNKEMK